MGGSGTTESRRHILYPKYITILKVQFSIESHGVYPMFYTITQGSSNHLANSLGKLGVPRPVTGSHPSVALKPLVPQPGLEPILISVKASLKKDE